MPRTARAGARKKREAPSESQLPRDERRSELLDAAYTLIAEKGLEGLRTRDIAARAGVNISTLHYYFGTKEELLVAVVERVRDTFTQRESGREPGKETLRAHLESAWRSFQTAPHLSVILQELLARAQRDPAARGALKTLHSFWNGVVEEVIRGGIERKELRADLDPAAGARIVTAFVIGATAQLGINPKAFDFALVARELERWARRSS
ncbi:MAG: TetR/AcrR family transcriptional regulator [Labilithrix sp.]|nr:TetR/AcrR family transcriptional regulator [Labilithrix sp.]